MWQQPLQWAFGHLEGNRKENMYELTERIKYSQLDRFGALSLTALLDLFQDCATMHTEDVGFPMDWFIKEKRGWFVTSYQIENYRLPRHGEVVRVRTFIVKPAKGFMGLRGFDLVDKDGNVLSHAYSEWVHMSLESGGPVRVSKEMSDAYILDEFDMSMFPGRKIKRPDKMDVCGSFIVDGIYLDTNFHMNNADYIVPAEQVLNGEGYTKIRMEFKSSAKKDDEVIIKRADIDGGEVISLESVEGSPYCVVEFK